MITNMKAIRNLEILLEMAKTGKKMMAENEEMYCLSNNSLRFTSSDGLSLMLLNEVLNQDIKLVDPKEDSDYHLPQAMVEQFREICSIPLLYGMITQGIVGYWDDGQHMKQLLPEHVEVIKKLEEDGWEYETKVIAVIKDTNNLGDEEVVMTLYILKDQSYTPWLIEEMSPYLRPEYYDDDDKRRTEKVIVWGFYAYVVNHTWKIEETGSVGIYEHENSLHRQY